MVVLRRKPLPMEEIAKLVVVAWVVVARRAVKFCSEVAPSTLSVPLAFSAPPTLSKLEIVVDDVTAKVPVLVAPVVVRPPLKLSKVEVPLEVKG